MSESPNTAAEFVPRSWRNRGRMSEGHRERLELRAAALGLADPAAAAAWSPQVLDIGFGFGESLLALAAARPRQRVLGVEVHPPGQLRAMDRLVEIGAENVRVLSADVTHLLPLLAPASLELVQAFHPDPWPKRRHAERRLISHRLLGRLVEVLAPGGMFHLVVDDDTYAAAAVAAAESLPLRVVEPPQAPETKYGRRAVAAGRTVHSLAWQRI
ncbi:MAG: tRNA (guanine(46)-N(7))-methyltransferase TrmB [Sporichthyaceae bacterium]